MLGCKKSIMSHTALQLKEEINQSSNESLNLLYVALTRAKQILIMTGVNAQRSSQEGWHAQCRTALDIDEESTEAWFYEHHTKPELDACESHAPVSIEISNDYTDLFSPITESTTNSVTPEQAGNEALEGTLIHKLLEVLTQSPGINDQALLNRVNLEANTNITPDELTPLKNEALNCLNSISLAEIFRQADNQKIYHELAVASTTSTQQISIIDQMIVREDSIWIIDYKTQADISEVQAQEEAKKFTTQLKRYADAVQPMYPSLPIRCSVVFTKIALLVDVPISGTSTD